MLISLALEKLAGNPSDSLTQQPVSTWVQVPAHMRNRSAPTVCLVLTVLMQARSCGACRCRSQPMSSPKQHATRLPIRVSVVSSSTAFNHSRMCTALLAHTLLQVLPQDGHGKACNTHNLYMTALVQALTCSDTTAICTWHAWQSFLIHTHPMQASRGIVVQMDGPAKGSRTTQQYVSCALYGCSSHSCA